MIWRVYKQNTICLVPVIIAVLIARSACRDAVVAAVDVTPPQRPAVFQTVEELEKYLQRLNEYYTIIGRPRFG
jgi:hypothetical protein